MKALSCSLEDGDWLLSAMKSEFDLSTDFLINLEGDLLEALVTPTEFLCWMFVL